MSSPRYDARVRPLDRAFLQRDAVETAPLLLNKVLAVGECSGRIVEVEAYRSDEAASHTFRGRTARNAVMFGPAGHLYVYLSYGMHHCANVVTGRDGDGQAVLLRALTPLSGIEEMRARRLPGVSLAGLTDGPGKLCQALGLTLADSGRDVCAGGPVRLGDDGTPPPPAPIVTPRIGISKAVDLPWRFVVPGIRVSGVVRDARSGRGSRSAPPHPRSRRATS